MSKRSQLDKALESIDAKIAVLQAARFHVQEAMQSQRATKRSKGPKAVPEKVEAAARG